MCCLLFSLLLLSSSALAEGLATDDPRPPSGVGGLIVGYAGLGVAGLNLATLPVCFTDLYSADAQDACVGVSVAFVAGGLVAGVSGLVVGSRRRREYKAWRARQQGERVQLEDVRLTLDDRSAGVGLRFSF